MRNRAKIFPGSKQPTPSEKTEPKLPSNGEAYLRSLENLEVVEYVRCSLPDAHILKVPNTNATISSQCKATELGEEVWQGTIKVVDRNDMSVILLVEKGSEAIAAVWPLEDPESVQRCIDSSRYFVVQIQDDNKSQFMAIAFNERTAAFDFNVAMQTSQREREERLKKLHEENDPMSIRELQDKPLLSQAKETKDRSKPMPKPQAKYKFKLPPLQFGIGKQSALLKPSTKDTPISTSRNKAASEANRQQNISSTKEEFFTFPSGVDDTTNSFSVGGSLWTSLYQGLCCAS